MSPSWISRRLKGGRPRATVGIAIGRREVCAVHAMFGEKGARIQAIDTAPLPEAMFTGAPMPDMDSALESVFARMAKVARGKFIPCHVAVPDPAMIFSVFELDELPKSGKTCLELVRRRIAKEYAVDGESLNCAQQALGREDVRQLLLGQGMDKAWLQCIQHALRRAGITPWSLNQAACYGFNQFHARFATEKHGAAMVVLDADSWAVLLWDAATRPRLIRSRWRTGAGGAAQDYDQIALEAERLILSYVRAGKDSAITRVYVMGHAREMEEFTAILDRRLREKCLPLAAPGADAEDNRKLTGHGLAPLSLAAASAR